MSRFKSLLVTKLQCLKLGGSVEMRIQSLAQSPYWLVFIDVHECMTKLAGLAVGTVQGSYWPGFARNLG